MIFTKITSLGQQGGSTILDRVQDRLVSAFNALAGIYQPLSAKRTVVANNASLGNNADTIFCNPNNATWTMTLPDARSFPFPSLSVHNTGIGSSSLTLVPVFGQSIAYGSAASVGVGTSVTLFTDGTDWWV